MFANFIHRIALLGHQSPERSLAVSTLFAIAVVMGCRSLVSLISHDPAELDGFIFLAGLYWACSAVGYVATRSKARRKSLVISARPRRRASLRKAALIGCRGVERAATAMGDQNPASLQR